MAQYVAPSTTPSVTASIAAPNNMAPHAVNMCDADSEDDHGGGGDSRVSDGGGPRASAALVCGESVVVSVRRRQCVGGALKRAAMRGSAI